MFNPLYWIYEKLDAYFSQDEESVISELKNDITECKNTIQEFKDSLANEVAECDNVKNDLAALQEEMKPFKFAFYGSPSPIPNFLTLGGDYYKPKMEILTQSGNMEFISIEPKDLYLPAPSTIELVTQLGWANMPHDVKLLKIWDYALRNIGYRFDFNENWQRAEATLKRGWGDCEDGTILFIVLCRIAGIPSGRVFNACGWFKGTGGQFGHSYPIAQMEDGNWYIFETTVHGISGLKPVNFFTQTAYDATWGLQNWFYQGGMKVTSNNPGYDPNGMIKQNSEEENEEKQKALKKFWEQNV